MEMRFIILGVAWGLVRLAAIWGVAKAAALIGIIPEQYVVAFDMALWGMLAGNIVGQIQRQPHWWAKDKWGKGGE